MEVKLDIPIDCKLLEEVKGTDKWVGHQVIFKIHYVDKKKVLTLASLTGTRINIPITSLDRIKLAMVHGWATEDATEAVILHTLNIDDDSSDGSMKTYKFLFDEGGKDDILKGVLALIREHGPEDQPTTNQIPDDDLPFAAMGGGRRKSSKRRKSPKKRKSRKKRRSSKKRKRTRRKSNKNSFRRR